MKFEAEVIQDIQQQIVSKGKAVLLHGLTDEEARRLEGKFHFRFPPDFLAFLQVAVPVNPPKDSQKSGIPKELPEFYQTASDRWHNWHNLARNEVGVGSEEDTVTKQILWHATPKDQPHPKTTPLVPIFAHRMIPCVPLQRGNPVFSMHGCYDNICYGKNFWDWLEQEKLVDQVPEEWKEMATPLEDIPFWKDYID